MTTAKKTHSSIALACAQYIKHLESTEILSERPVKINGIGRSEITRVASEVSSLLANVEVRSLSDNDDEPNITFGNAVRLRNQSFESNQPFVLLVSVEVAAEGSLDDAAFHSVDREDLFELALEKLNVPSYVVRLARTYGRFTDSESIHDFVHSEGNGVLSPQSLGLLQDSSLTTIEEVSENQLSNQLAFNNNVSNILKDSKISSWQLESEFAGEMQLDLSNTSGQLYKLTEWLDGSREDPPPSLFDLNNWPETSNDPPTLDFVTDLSGPPHSGWSLRLGLVEANFEDIASTSWEINGISKNVTVTVEILEANSGEPIHRFKKSRSTTRRIDWAKIIGPTEKAKLYELDEHGIEDGFQLSLNLVVEWNKKPLISKESDSFWLSVKVDSERERISALENQTYFTQCQVKYAFIKTQRCDWNSTTLKPRGVLWDGVEFDIKGLEKVNEKKKTERSASVGLQLDPELLSMQKRIMESGDGSMLQWNAENMELSRGDELSDVTQINSLLKARKALFESLIDSGPIESVDLTPTSPTASLAIDYVDRYASFAHELNFAKLNDNDRHEAAKIASMDCVRVALDGSKNQDLIMFPPIHPVSLGWLIEQAKLYEDWGSTDPDSMPETTTYPLTEQCGPRALTIPVASNGNITWWTYLGNYGGNWQVFAPENASADLRASDWRSQLMLAIGGESVGTLQPSFSSRTVGRKLADYLRFHPHIRKMNVWAISPGSGKELLDALRVAKKTHTMSDDLGREIPLTFNAKLIGPNSDRFAVDIEEFYQQPGSNRWKDHSKDLLESDDRPLNPSLSLGISRLKTEIWREIIDEVNREKENDPTSGVHIAVVGPSLSVKHKPASMSQQDLDQSSFIANGLGARPRATISPSRYGSQFTGGWDFVLHSSIDSSNYAEKSAGALSRLASYANEQELPVSVSVQLADHDQSAEALGELHSWSDWVVIADPMFAPEFFDGLQPHGEEPTILLDYTPPAASFLESRVLVTTAFQDELEKFESTIEAGGIDQPKSAILALMSISGRLLLKLATPTRSIVGELRGLALSRALIERKFPGSLVIPIDDHITSFTDSAPSAANDRADLLAITKTDDQLTFTVIESKWSTGKDGIPRQREKGISQARSTSEWLKKNYGTSNEKDLKVRREQFLELVEFHRQRAIRFGVKVGFDHKLLADAILNFDQPNIGKIVAVWSPDPEQTNEVENNDGTIIYISGQSELAAHGKFLEAWLQPDPITPNDSVDQPPQPTLSSDPARTDFDSEPPSNIVSPVRDLGSTDTNPDKILHLPVNSTTLKIEDQPTPMKVSLGTNLRTEKPVFWRPDECLNGHMVVIGGSGAGKTTTLRKMISEIRTTNVPVLVIDFHGDITPAHRNDEELIKFTYDENDFFINPFYLDKRFSEWIRPTRVKNEFIEAWNSHYPSMGVQQANAIRRMIDSAFEGRGITSDPSTWNRQIDFADLRTAFDDFDMRPAERATLEAYFARYEESQIFHGTNGIAVESFLNRSHRLDLSQLDTDTRNVLADVVLRRLFLLAKGMGPISSEANGTGKFRTFVAIDEAQLLMGSRRNAQASIAKYASEARKFGVGLLLATQLRTTVPNDVWLNIDSRFFMQALDRDERIKNANAANVSESELQELPKGGGLLFSASEARSRPTRVQITPP